MDSDVLLGIIRSSGLDADFQVAARTTILHSVSLERGELTNLNINENAHVYVRCIYKKRASTVAAPIEERGDILNLLKKAYTLAKLSGSTDTQSRFSMDKHKKGGTSLSKNIDKLNVAELISKMASAKNAAQSELDPYSINLGVEYSQGKLHIANSNGVSGDWEGSVANAESEVVAKEGAEQASGRNEESALDVAGLNLERLVMKTATLAKRMLGGKPAPSFVGELLLSPETSKFLVGFLVPAMSGEEIFKKRSFLLNKNGTEIASKLINLREEKSMRSSPYNRQFDDELTPTSSKYLIKNGVLKTYLHNIYSAEKLHEKPTGNYFPSSLGGDIDVTNLILAPGKFTTEKLVSKIKRGIYLIETDDSPNRSTGDFSAMVVNGYYVENGKLIHPLKETMIGTNIIDLFKNVRLLGSDAVTLDGISAPAMLIDNVQISGK